MTPVITTAVRLVRLSMKERLRTAWMNLKAPLVNNL
jgi:hypothetical protein